MITRYNLQQLTCISWQSPCCRPWNLCRYAQIILPALFPLALNHRCYQQRGDWWLFCLQCWQCLCYPLRRLSRSFSETIHQTVLKLRWTGKLFLAAVWRKRLIDSCGNVTPSSTVNVIHKLSDYKSITSLSHCSYYISYYVWRGFRENDLNWIMKALSALEAEQSPTSALLMTLIA